MKTKATISPAKQRILASTLAALVVFAQAVPAAADRTRLKPGWNIFKPAQDIELGREASAEAEKQLPLLRDPRVDAYLNRLGRRLAAQAPGHEFPYQFKSINDGAINAFALPGGFIYINRGTIEAADNEAQLAGVIAHEIAHVALRHGTNQLTKAMAWRFPLVIAGGLLGGSGSLTGQLAQLGIAVGFSAVFLKYSRTAETQADLMGTQILYDAGLEPKEMAVFFQKLERSGGGGRIEFFSDHPSPKNRVKRVEKEISKLGAKPGLQRDSDEFHAIRSRLQSLPPPPKRGARGRPQARTAERPEPPSARFRTYRGRDFAFAYPDNWQAYEEDSGVVLAPAGGVVATQSGANALAYGVIANLLELEEPDASLEDATERLLDAIRRSNPDIREVSRQRARLARRRALSVHLVGPSPIRGEHEIDWLLTVKRRHRLFYLLCVAPDKEFRDYRPTCERILDSLRLR
ncbi:MAG: M48 family metallopeptidase [Terriglobia bacterium]